MDWFLLLLLFLYFGSIIAHCIVSEITTTNIYCFFNPVDCYFSREKTAQERLQDIVAHTNVHCLCAFLLVGFCGFILPTLVDFILLGIVVRHPESLAGKLFLRVVSHSSRNSTECIHFGKWTLVKRNLVDQISRSITTRAENQDTELEN
jgi:hypothetical protein